MAGTIMTVLEMTDFDFTNVGAGLSVSVPLLQNIDVSRYKTATLQVRIHQNGIQNSGLGFLKLRRVLPSAQEPSQIFLGDIVCTAQFGSNLSPGAVVTQAVTEPLGGFLTLLVSVDQNATTPSDLFFKISAELLLNDC